MTATLHTHPRPLASDDLYNSDDADLRNSPLLKPINPKLKHEPSPEPSLPYISSSSPSAASSPGPGERKRRRTKNRASLSDAVLVSFLGSGLHSDVARQAGERPLASDNEDDESPVKGTRINMDKDAAPRAERGVNGDIAKDDETRPAETKTDHLAALAAGALAHEGGVYRAAEGPATSAYQERHDATRGNAPGESMDDVRHALPSIAVAVMGQPGMRMSPEAVVKPENQTRGGLPPIQHRSPPAPPAMIGIGASSGTGVTLPSLSESIGDLNHIKDAAKKAEPTFSQSPPSRPPPRFHGGRTPPKSPTDQFHRPQLPSPGQPGSHYTYHAFTHRRMSQTEPHYVSAGDYSSSTTETPSTDNSGPTPSAIPIDRMSIDGITNPQMGGYQCTHTGCTAQPFQTQYLLNSHANVHSQNRPHYCSVKGCPRSEGGKGFKRKNEMIRHGLVHDSPGYVCPFCPDREHKYPRPDNLQRHVRVHHVDKDKDDAQLRDVLAQRPEGPSRGRRRRGGTS